MKAFSAVEETAATGLKTSILEFSSAELTSGGGLLLKHLLLVCIGVADLDDVLLTSLAAHRGVVELLDDILADVSCLEADEQVSKCNRSKRRRKKVTYRQKPTPRPLLASSRRIFDEQTLKGRK